MASSSTACTTGTAFPLCGGEFLNFIGWDTKFGANFGGLRETVDEKIEKFGEILGEFFCIAEFGIFQHRGIL